MMELKDKVNSSIVLPVPCWRMWAAVTAEQQRFILHFSKRAASRCCFTTLWFISPAEVKGHSRRLRSEPSLWRSSQGHIGRYGCVGHGGVIWWMMICTLPWCSQLSLHSWACGGRGGGSGGAFNCGLRSRSVYLRTSHTWRSGWRLIGDSSWETRPLDFGPVLGWWPLNSSLWPLGLAVISSKDTLWARNQKLIFKIWLHPLTLWHVIEQVHTTVNNNYEYIWYLLRVRFWKVTARASSAQLSSNSNFFFFWFFISFE